MVHEGWYMVQESKLWYDYIIMVRSGNAGFRFRRFFLDDVKFMELAMFNLTRKDYFSLFF